MGIEPTSEAWEASILPLYDARSPIPRYEPQDSTGLELGARCARKILEAGLERPRSSAYLYKHNLRATQLKFDPRSNRSI